MKLGKITLYKCDGCGCKTSVADDDLRSSFAREWVTIGERHLCPMCHWWSNNDGLTVNTPPRFARIKVADKSPFARIAASPFASKAEALND